MDFFTGSSNGVRQQSFFPDDFRNDNNSSLLMSEEKIQQQTWRRVLFFVLFQMQQGWRFVISCVLALVIYTLFSWLPNFIAMLLTAVLLCAFGQYDVKVSNRKQKIK